MIGYNGLMSMHIRQIYMSGERLTRRRYVNGQMHHPMAFQVQVEAHPISRQDRIEQDEAIIGMPIPEIYFGDNKLVIYNDTMSLCFCALDALKTVSHEVQFKVQNARPSKYEEAKPYDWTYAMRYKGTLCGHVRIEETSMPQFLPMDLLKKKCEIHQFESVDLFEDELGDNGTSLVNVKYRAMSFGWFCLLRQFIRIDHVHYIQHEVRYSHLHNESIIKREVMSMSCPYDTIGHNVDDIREYLTPLISPESYNTIVTQEIIHMVNK